LQAGLVEQSTNLLITGQPSNIKQQSILGWDKATILKHLLKWV
jgi:hypothetical protein